MGITWRLLFRGYWYPIKPHQHIQLVSPISIMMLLELILIYIPSNAPDIGIPLCTYIKKHTYICIHTHMYIYKHTHLILMYRPDPPSFPSSCRCSSPNRQATPVTKVAIAVPFGIAVAKIALGVPIFHRPSTARTSGKALGRNSSGWFGPSWNGYPLVI